MGAEIVTITEAVTLLHTSSIQTCAIYSLFTRLHKVSAVTSAATYEVNGKI